MKQYQTSNQLQGSPIEASINDIKTNSHNHIELINSVGGKRKKSRKCLRKKSRKCLRKKSRKCLRKKSRKCLRKKSRKCLRKKSRKCLRRKSSKRLRRKSSKRLRRNSTKGGSGILINSTSPMPYSPGSLYQGNNASHGGIVGNLQNLFLKTNAEKSGDKM